MNESVELARCSYKVLEIRGDGFVFTAAFGIRFAVALIYGDGSRTYQDEGISILRGEITARSRI